MIQVINDYLEQKYLKVIQDLMYEPGFWSYDPFKVRYNDIEEDDLRDCLLYTSDAADEE